MSQKGQFHRGLLNNPSVPRFEVFVTLAVGHFEPFEELEEEMDEKSEKKRMRS